jgi:transposase
MSNHITPEYNQQFLFPPCLEDFIAKDDPVKFLREFVDSIDLKKEGFIESEDNIGRPSYSCNLLLKILLYGSYEGIKSFRKIERLCKRDVGMMWISGMNYPDHNSIWRFFKNNRNAIKSVYKQSVRIAIKNNLVGMILQVIDGTKIRADVNSKKKISQKRLEYLLDNLDEISEEIIEGMEEENPTESEESVAERLDEDLQNRKKLREKIKSDLEELKSKGIKGKYPSDIDARTMMMKDGSYQAAYNCQVNVDSKKGIIVGAVVGQNSSDYPYLVEVLEETSENTDMETVELTIADKGYFSGDNLQKAEDKGYNVLVNIPQSGSNHFINKENLFHKNNFKYEKEKDIYICPNDKELTFRGYQRKRKKKYVGKVYKCSDYGGCQFAKECNRNKNARQITINVFDEIISRKKKELEDPIKIELIRRRKEIVERVFGYIKRVFNYTRTTFRGLENMRAQWYLICTIINLRKIQQALL